MPSNRNSRNNAGPLVIPGEKNEVTQAIAIHNTTNNTVEVRYPGFPGDEHTGLLKFFGGKWDKEKEFWYGPAGGGDGELTFANAAELSVDRFNANIEKWQAAQTRRRMWAEAKAATAG